MSGSSQLRTADPAPTRTRESIALHRTWVRKAREHRNLVRRSPEGRGAAEVETEPTAPGRPGPGATSVTGLGPAEESRVLHFRAGTNSAKGAKHTEFAGGAGGCRGKSFWGSAGTAA